MLKYNSNISGASLGFLCRGLCYMRGLPIELHSPLTNSTGLSTEAKLAKLELEWSICLCREHKRDTEHHFQKFPGIP